MCDNSLVLNDKKNNRKFVQILRRLAKLEDLTSNKIKVTICENEIIEEKNKIFIASPAFIKCYKNNAINNSIGNKNEKIKKNLNREKKNSAKNEIEEEEYPDSSDFSDDEE